LPESGDFSEDLLLVVLGGGGGEGKVVEKFEAAGDAPAFEQDSAARNFGGMRSEDGRDLDLVEGLG